ncbi:MAG TPA: response regulator, partial [Candidatus Saccharimonas sp.]|nr:response regulator [Candidatus Saccharimonas sp.]
MAKILVAEDDRFLATAYRAKLTKVGFEVTVATDGEEVLAALPQIVPDIILLDLVMPRKDGFA